MARVLSYLIRNFSNYYTLHRSDLAARAAPLDPRLLLQIITSQGKLVSPYHQLSLYRQELNWELCNSFIPVDVTLIQRTFPRIAFIGSFVLWFFRNVVSEFNQIDSLKNAQYDTDVIEYSMPLETFIDYVCGQNTARARALVTVCEMI